MDTGIHMANRMDDLIQSGIDMYDEMESVRLENEMLEDAYAEVVRLVDENKATLRDQLAMAAITGFAKNYRSATAYTKGGNVDKCMQLDAELAYGLADAMMEARKSKEPPC
jgi:hypothetical protein